MDKHIYKQYLVWLSLGTILEWFDFSLYGILAIRMSKVFFSTANPHAFLLTLLTFGVAFISRPIGALFFGYFGDRSSKYYSVNYSILVMASATFLIGVTPTYGSIGWIAPILLMIIRFTQGISLGGQFTGLITIIVENKQLNKTFLIGVCNSIALLGFLIAYLVGLLISFLETSFIAQTWIWRLPYLSSILIFGFYLCIQPKKDFIHDHFNNTPLPSYQSNSLTSSLISQYSEMIFSITISISFGTL